MAGKGGGARWSEEDYKAHLKRAGKPAAAGEMKRAVRTQVESKIEVRFAQQLAENGIVQRAPTELFYRADAQFNNCSRYSFTRNYDRNYLDAVRGRGFELDFAWPVVRFFVEVDGMAHRTRERFLTDSAKHAELLFAGWRGLRVNGPDVRDGRAIEWTMRALELVVNVRWRGVADG